MKIAQQQLTGHLKRDLAPIYVVSGDEWLLVDEACALIRNVAQARGFIEREIFQVDAAFDWQDLLLRVNNLSLFSESSLIELQLAKLKIGDNGSAVLQNYAANPPPDKLLLLIINKLDAATQNSRWFKALDSAGVTVQIWPIDKQNLPGWVANRLKQVGMQLSQDGVQLLIEHTEGNLLALTQEITKLQLIFGSSAINVDQLIAALTDNSRFNVFELITEVLEGNSKRVIHMMDSLMQSGTEPAIVLWAIARELRLLLNVAYSNKTLGDLDRAMQMHKVHLNQKNLFKKVLQKCNINALENLLRHAAKVDLLIKGAVTGDVWHELLRLCLKFG